MFKADVGQCQRTLTSQNSRRYRLRSTDTTDYIVPQARTKFGDKAFCVAGPTVWNCLPESLRSADSTSSFKQQLKAHSFNLHFNCFSLLFSCFELSRELLYFKTARPPRLDRPGTKSALSDHWLLINHGFLESVAPDRRTSRYLTQTYSLCLPILCITFGQITSSKAWESVFCRATI